MKLLGLLSIISVALAAPIAVGGNPLAEGAEGSALKRLTERGASWDYQNDKIRGVNLGGWFVLEPYITPSLFEVFSNSGDDSEVPIDEYHYTEKLGKEVALSRLQAHWSSWYTEADFSSMADLGLNFVRIPIGYWAFDLMPNDPYVQGQIEYFDQALEWAAKYNLKAWVDLHGVQGSQNGFDNSGLRDAIEWQNGDNVQFTLNVLDSIFEKYGNGNYSNTVIGIELVNEPLGPALDVDKLKDFYSQGYKNMRATGSVTPVVVHDAFLQPGYWDNFLTYESGDCWGVVVDHHHYQVFSPAELQRDIDEHIDVTCNWGWDAKKESHWNVCGEWSAALTDCALWLNGVGRGARWLGDYDNSPVIGSCSDYWTIQNWSSEHKENVRKYIEAQLDAYEETGGWVFWNWKCENADEWDFQRLTVESVFPQPLNDRTYPNQCNF